jgi:hypothetical protein
LRSDHLYLLDEAEQLAKILGASHRTGQAAQEKWGTMNDDTTTMNDKKCPMSYR